MRASQGSTGDDFRAGAGAGDECLVRGRGRGAIGDVHTTTPAPVTRRGRGRGDRANHGKTKYLRVDGNHADHKKKRIIHVSVVERIKIGPFRGRMMFRQSRDMT